MKLITEDFVSYEIAKLLKEKGFDSNIYTCYTDCEFPEFLTMIDYVIQGEEYERSDFESHNLIQAPTHQMALKWLREVHKLFVKVNYTTHPIIKDKNYYGTVINMEDVRETVLAFEDALTYEDCVNSLLKYALETLI